MNPNHYRSISNSIFRCLPRNPRSPHPQVARFSTPTQEPKPPSEKVSEIANELSSLTLLEVSDLTELLRSKLGSQEMAGMQFASAAGVAAPKKPKT